MSTGTAWNYLMSVITSKPFLIEFDLTKCFDSIYHFSVHEALVRAETPQFLYSFISGTMFYARFNVEPEVRQVELDQILAENSVDHSSITG